VKVKVQHEVEMTEVQFAKVLPKFLRSEIKFLEDNMDNCSLFSNDKRTVEALKVVHNYYAKPNKWFREVETTYEALP
jgi:hypothetical protein